MSTTQTAIDELRRTLDGEVRADRLTRALYATDASIYEIVPDGVILPRSEADVQAAVRACRRHGAPITPRGAGTGLAGGCVNRGLQMDLSRHLNRIVAIDAETKTAIVEPGVVLDELNAAAAAHGLHFAPDVATSSRATLGGMIANNSCGAHSVMYGRTVDHVLALRVVLSDGSIACWGEADVVRRAWPGDKANGNASAPAGRCADVVATICRENADEIAARFPKVMRRNGGYALDRIQCVGGRVNIESLICGSEGTLGIVVGAALKLTPLPKHRGLVIAHFHELLDALTATPTALEHGPAAVELIDKLILDAARRHPSMQFDSASVEGDPHGLLIIELFDESAESLSRRLRAVADDLQRRGLGYAWQVIESPEGQERIWNVRRNGLGLLMSRPGDRHAFDFVEDTAVEPAKLRDYIERFMRILDDEGVRETSYYAHASVGCLHVKPVLNLKDGGDIARMHRIADRISSLALAFGGTMTGEHGDGILRSQWLEKMYGPRIIDAFRRVKATFDPDGILNPGKIVDPLPMMSHFRYSTEYTAQRPATTLDFDAHGGMAGMAEMCSGVGQCRKTLVGTMCPSYMATGDERHTTRGRANALRLALSNRDVLGGLSDAALDEVMDLCVSCKACKTECPTGVDMAKLKSEWLHQRHRRRGAPLRSRLIARVDRWAAIGNRAAPLANYFSQATWFRAALDALLGIDARIAPPALARESFRSWWSRRGKTRRGTAIGRVAYFVDTWTNYFTPQVGVAAVSLLERLGYEVVVPPAVCCGRPAISKGMLDVARSLALRNVRALLPAAREGLPIVGTEPSCILTFADEFTQLARTDDAREISARCTPLETFVAAHLDRHGPPQRSASNTAVADTSLRALYHGHCHQKAMTGTADVMRVLRTLTGCAVEEIDAGCCGMAGSFGHEKEHYDVARAIGEQRLFPAVRGRGDSAVLVAGFSCRCQIEHHTTARPMHWIEGCNLS